jgi:undecaprenyl-diphosphatase
MEWWQALILGIVEGLTEYLPVSSTGHLLLINEWLGLNSTEESRRAAFTFDIIIQAGAIAAVFGLYRKRIWEMIQGLAFRPGHEKGRKLAFNLIVAFMPAAVLGLLLRDVIHDNLNGPWPIAGALFVGAWLMIAIDYSRKLSKTEHKGAHLDQITWKIALLIGIGQCVAMWPGTSRSMMTIGTALLLGMRPRAAAEFSFLLGLITLGAATGYESVKHGTDVITQFGWTPIIIGFIGATISAAMAVNWFVAFLTRRGLAPFAWYRLALASLVAILILTGLMNSTPPAPSNPNPPASEVQKQ